MTCVGNGKNDVEVPGILRVPVDPYSSQNMLLPRDVVEPSNTGEEFLWRSRQ